MNSKLICILITIVITAGCTEKVNLKLDSTYTHVVVYGVIEADTGAYRVTVTKSADYFSNTPVPKIVSASVSITDGSNTYLLHETQTGISGIYQTDPDFVADTGKTYTLHIQIPEPVAGNSTFEASSYLPPVTPLDSIATEFNPNMGPKGVWIIKLWAQEPGDEVNYYLFNFYRNGQLMTDSITKKVVFDDKFYNGSYMTGVNTIYINNEHSWTTLHHGDTVTLQMSGITKEYFNFITQVKQSGYSIPFFSGPPANVQGNINNGGIGFFAAYANTYATTIVK
jgi:hypothetical protein